MNSEINQLRQALINRFGPDAFVQVRSDKYSGHYAVFASSQDRRVELFVRAHKQESQRGRYSVQVEVAMDQPDFDIVVHEHNLPLDKVLNVFAENQTYPAEKQS
jgi:hypothetical protein